MGERDVIEDKGVVKGKSGWNEKGNDMMVGIRRDMCKVLLKNGFWVNTVVRKVRRNMRLRGGGCWQWMRWVE